MRSRLEQILEGGGETVQFANWDQDVTAVERDYGSQDPAVVAAELVEAARSVAMLYASVTDATRDRRGLRSNGDEFTV